MPGFEWFDDIERKEVNDVLDSGVLMRYGFDGARNGHWKAKELEQAIEKKMDVKHAQLLSSGTAAVTTALAIAGVGAGDEVIMPTFTFVASFESVIAVGATPILVDVDESLTLNPDAVKAAITDRTKAIMPVHMCGAMADLDALKKICVENNLQLVEDACQAFGGSYKGTALGAYGDVGCYSFDYVKTITCGEGGAVITNNDDFAVKADAYQDHGHDHVGNDRGAESHPHLGFNYRISELNAAVGIAQMGKLDKIIEVQKKNKTILKEALATIEEVSFRVIPDPEGDNFSFLSFFLPTEELTRKVHAALGEFGTDGNFYWFDNNWHYVKKWQHLHNLESVSPISKQIREGMPNYAEMKFPASDEVISRTISTLIKLNWTEEEVKERADKMVAAIKSVL
ncbi:MAG: DegT/DnrJ/EryC1/StrS family aminotransferase [Bacteroidota bacterium]